MAPVISTVIYPVKDLAKARTLYGALLGVAPAQDESD
jgi:extradiol dioxygenase family protein